MPARGGGGTGPARPCRPHRPAGAPAPTPPAPWWPDRSREYLGQRGQEGVVLQWGADRDPQVPGEPDQPRHVPHRDIAVKEPPADLIGGVGGGEADEVGLARPRPHAGVMELAE